MGGLTLPVFASISLTGLSLIPATKQKLSGTSDEAAGNQIDDVILSGCLNWWVSNVPWLVSLRLEKDQRLLAVLVEGTLTCVCEISDPP